MQTLQYMRSGKATTNERMLYLVQHIRKLLTPKDHWIQGTYAQDKFGAYTEPNGPDAATFCLTGAYVRIRDKAKLGEAANTVLWKLISDTCQTEYHRSSVTVVNDIDGYESVLDVLSTIEQMVMERIRRDGDAGAARTEAEEVGAKW